MGWANCGEDRNGRPIGYAVEAKCDEPGCEVKIDRGLAYVCGDMHGEDELSCDKYFCNSHKPGAAWTGEHLVAICNACVAEMKKAVEDDSEFDEGWRYDEPEDVFHHSRNPYKTQGV